jgi:DNA-binding NtrC family response regulator
VQAFRLHLVPEDGAAPKTWDALAPRCTLGSNAKNDVALTDRAVSRFHAEIRVEADGVRICDLGSRNGTIVDGVPITDAWLREGSTIRLGRTTLRVGLDDSRATLRLSTSTKFGGLVGASVAMRATFLKLERAAGTDATVLLTGETGTGKEEAAQGIHDTSERAEGPFIVVDCGNVAASLVESELFGHERGAFTGADRARAGAFEAAHGGTIFLDELGELPLDLQPTLLRVLERRRVRRVGSNEERPVDVRVIAATNRDLRAAVNAGTFREDLYYRLAVVEIDLPPLRARPEDLPMLVDTLLERLDPDSKATWVDREALLARIGAAAWPGNVRQLRNYVARSIALGEAPALGAPSPGGARAASAPVVIATGSYEEARRHALDAFEKDFATALLERFDGNVSEAARSAGLNRTYLHRILRRHGIRG